MDFTQPIRARREKAVRRALAVLESYGDSDADTRGSLLKVAGKALRDSRVAERWIELLAAETDQGQRRDLLMYLSDLDFRQVPNNAECAARLLSCLDQPDARDWALYCLTRMAPHDPQMFAPLIAAYRAQQHDFFAKNILAALLGLSDPPPELLAFLASVLGEVNAQFKLAILRRLLDRDALDRDALEKLLASSEPEQIKVHVLEHLIDRSILIENATVELLRHDPAPACRYAAAWALTETGAVSSEAFDALIQAAASDPDEHVRTFAIASFEHTLAKTPAAIAALLDALKTETLQPRALLILRLIAPHAFRDPQIVAGLQALLEKNLHTDIALEMIALLGELAPWNEAVRDWLIDAFVCETEDRVKAAILRPLSKLDDGRISKLCTEAVKLPDPEIRQWGLRGVILLPLLPENAAAITECATLLLVKDIELDLRVRLAHKIALLPKKDAALLNRLKEVAAQSRDSQIKQICEEVSNKALNDKIGDPSADDVTVDWDAWLHRAEIEHRGDGIFPAMYEHYDDNPEAAKRVLKALLNPQCKDSLYSAYGYDVGDHSILELLDRKNAIDDDISRYCIGRVLTQEAGNPDGFLQYLSANPTYEPLRDRIWPILEKRMDANAALLREILVAAHGDEEAAAQALKERIASVRGADALPPYIRLFTENLAWPPSRDLLVALAAHGDLAGKARETVRAALTKLGVKEPAQTVATATKLEAGFADD